MKTVWIVLGIIFLVILMFGGWLVGGLNRVVQMDEAVNSSWAQVENQLQRRLDLIPNLVNTVKGYAKHEKEIFTQIAEARSKLAGAKSIKDKISGNRMLEGALSRLLLIVERYPDLKANQNFIRLQDELAGTENRIAVERRRYNSSVEVYNSTVRKFPTRFIIGFTGLPSEHIYFKAEEKAAKPPSVSFE